MTTLADKMRALQARLQSADAHYRLGGFATLNAVANELPALVIALERWITDYGDVPFSNGDVDGQRIVQEHCALLQRIEERIG